MPSAESLTPDSRFTGLFIGPKHSGKTVAACSFPHPIKVFDFDGRIRGILGASWIEKKGIDYTYYPPKIGKTDTSTFAKLNSDLEGLLMQCNSGQCPYKTVIIDSLTASCFALVCEATSLTHTIGGKGEKKSGKFLGTMAMPGPEDYGFEAQGTYQLIAFLRSLPIANVIVTAHVVEKYGKVDPDNPFSESVVIGEKLSLRDKIGVNIGIYFDNIFRFDRRMNGNDEHFYARFRSDLANTSFKELPDGDVDITGQSFYSYMMSRLTLDQSMGVAR